MLLLLASPLQCRAQALDVPFLASSDGSYYPALDSLMFDARSAFLLPSAGAVRALPGTVFNQTSGTFVASRTVGLFAASFLTAFAPDTTPLWDGSGALQVFDIRSTGGGRVGIATWVVCALRGAREYQLGAYMM